MARPWVGAVVGLVMAGAALASSHREAPLTGKDPLADNTDLYAFVSPEADRGDRVVVIANWIPFEKKESGPNFWGFDDDALYEIHVDNDGDANDDVTYQFRFTTTRQRTDTFLYNTGPVGTLADAKLNVRQTYELARVRSGQREVLGTGMPVAPANVGATSIANYALLRQAAIQTLPDGSRVFVGPRAEAFFADLGAVFDLLQISNQNPRPGVNALHDMNVHSIALEIPVKLLTKTGGVPTSVTDPAAVLGFYASTSRRQVTLLRPHGGVAERGAFVQVSRLGNPLVNELLVPLKDKDRFNATPPREDIQYEHYLKDPEVPHLLNALFGMNVPPAPRDDLVSVFFTGLPGLTQVPSGTHADLLRLNVAVPPAAHPDRMGKLGGDDAGFPNGRRIGDDVVDIALRAAAGVLVSGFDVEPNRSLADGVDAPDDPLLDAFPFLADPHAAR